MTARDYRRLHNEELIELLFTEEDRLPQAAADEIIRRGRELVPMLSEIALDRIAWVAELPEWWAPVHATYLLGAIGGKDVLTPLLAALRWSDAYDNQWITEDLPSILGSLGDISFSALIETAKDRPAGWSARSIAMDSLGSQALRRPSKEEEVMSLMRAILKDESEEHGARRSAAFILLDFRRADAKRELTAFAQMEERLQKQFSDYMAAFSVEDVESDLASARFGMDIYIRNWLDFYDADEIRRRQDRWAVEDGRPRIDHFSQTAQLNKQDFVIDRNAPCPCGSGKPYKRCCLGKLH